MKQELQNKLFTKYPRLFKDHNKSTAESCMGWGITCGDGWYDLLDSICQEFMDTCPDALYFEQVKEKFGALVIYTNYDGTGNKVVKEIRQIASRESTKICEFCGSIEDVQKRPQGYIRYLCPTCMENYYKILEERWVNVREA